MATTREKREKRENRYADAKKRASQHKSGYERTSIATPEGTKFFAIKKEGTYRVDILPYKVGKGAANPYSDEGFLHYERTFFTHRDVGAKQDTYLCPAKTFDQPCPICEHKVKLGKDEDADDDLIKSLLPKERQLFNVIDLADPDAGVQLWDISYHLFGKLLDTKIENADEGDNYDSFFYLDEGLTLKLTTKEKSFGGRSFYEVIDIEFKTRKQQYDDDKLDEVLDLDSLLKKVEYAKLRDIFLQLGEAEDGDDDEPKAKPAKAAKKSKPTPADEDDDDELPAKKPAKAKSNGKPLTAESKGLSDGDTVLYEDEEYEIDRISRDGTSLTLMDDDGELHKGIAVADVKRVGAKVETDPDVDDWDDDDDEPPAKKPAKAAKKAKPAPADDDDDELWDDDDEPPKKAAKPAKAKAKPAPVDDDDDDDDEPPVKKPAKAKKPAAKTVPDDDDDGDDWDDD